MRPVVPEALRRVPTPYLVVDVPAMQRNIARAAKLASGSTWLRPHFKAHKCTEIMRRQLDGGACTGVTCATVPEAAALDREGFDDILVANEVVHGAALDAVAPLATRATITIAVDSLVGIERLDAALVRHGARARVLIDIDVGQGRCGVTPGDPLVIGLARAAAMSSALDVIGVMGYDGHAQHRDAREREKSSRRVAEILSGEAGRLAHAGFDVAVLSGAGSGTLESAVRHGVLTEIQAGSYVLMDGDYGRLQLGFEQAVWCVASVVSRRSATEAVLDAGLKALSADDGLWQPVDGQLEAIGASDEHTTLRTSPDSEVAIGDLVRVVPSHLDPTMNLHDVVYAVGEGDGVQRWALD